MVSGEGAWEEKDLWSLRVTTTSILYALKSRFSCCVWPPNPFQVKHSESQASCILCHQATIFWVRKWSRGTGRTPWPLCRAH